MICPACKGCGRTIDEMPCPACGGQEQEAPEVHDRVHLPGVSPRSARKPYERPLVLASIPARLGVPALLGLASRPPGVPTTVPAAELARWRELALAGGPCRECDDALCTLARAVLAIASV